MAARSLMGPLRGTSLPRKIILCRACLACFTRLASANVSYKNGQGTTILEKPKLSAANSPVGSETAIIASKRFAVFVFIFPSTLLPKRATRLNAIMWNVPTTAVFKGARFISPLQAADYTELARVAHPDSDPLVLCELATADRQWC